MTVLAAALLPLLPLVTAPTDAATRPRTTVIADCVHHSVRPRRVIIACGDGALSVVVRHYRYWRADEARGRGAVWANDCDPNCASGTFHRTRVSVRFFRPVTRDGHVEFTRLAVRWRHGDRHGRDVYWLPTKGF